MGVDVETLLRTLCNENPRIFVDSDHIADSQFTIIPMCLTDDETEYVIDRLRAQQS